MKVLKNIAEWIALFLILLLSMGAFAESKKEASQDTAKYELKSDIINFDYTEMAYPLQEAKVGSDFSLVKKNLPPKKIVRGEGPSQGLIIANSIGLPFLLVVSMIGCCFLILCMLVCFHELTELKN